MSHNIRIIKVKEKDMRIAVHHSTDRLGTSFDRMCTVEAPQTDVYEALEYAYRYTNNINGSWSRNDIENNDDWNENVTQILPLEDGMGHRSTSMFDRMLVEGEWYEVAAMGFEKMDAEASAASLDDVLATIERRAAKRNDDKLAEKGLEIIKQARAKSQSMATSERLKSKAKKLTKKEIVAKMIQREGLDNRKHLTNLIMTKLNVTKANAGVYIYNYMRTI
tara:strand:- start:159 stop:821 length:663 start_codon:yes stop_codon:yes gene_type:complete